MAKIARKSAVRHARQLEEVIYAPGPDGQDVPIAIPGDWATYVEKDDELVFKGFVTEQAYREKHCRVG